MPSRGGMAETWSGVVDRWCCHCCGSLELDCWPIWTSGVIVWAVGLGYKLKFWPKIFRHSIKKQLKGLKGPALGPAGPALLSPRPYRAGPCRPDFVFSLQNTSPALHLNGLKRAGPTGSALFPGSTYHGESFYCPLSLFIIN